MDKITHNHIKENNKDIIEVIQIISNVLKLRHNIVLSFIINNSLDAIKILNDITYGNLNSKDIVTAIVGYPDNEYKKAIIKRYSIALNESESIPVLVINKQDFLKVLTDKNPNSGAWLELRSKSIPKKSKRIIQLTETQFQKLLYYIKLNLNGQ